MVKQYVAGLGVASRKGADKVRHENWWIVLRQRGQRVMKRGEGGMHEDRSEHKSPSTRKGALKHPRRSEKSLYSADCSCEVCVPFGHDYCDADRSELDGGIEQVGACPEKTSCDE